MMKMRLFFAIFFLIQFFALPAAKAESASSQDSAAGPASLLTQEPVTQPASEQAAGAPEAVTEASPQNEPQNPVPATGQEGQAEAVPSEAGVQDSSKETLAPTEASIPLSPEEEVTAQVEFVSPPIDLSRFPSLFFSVWEHDLISDARRGLNTRPPDTGTGREGEAADPIESPREISLGGIVYKSSKNWTVWLNGMRISPDRIPAEVMDIKVYKDYIELEWFDAQTNQIFPVRMKAHQRFNLDARLFLPGQ